MILLHFFGLGDVLRRFELEQITGLTIMGFRPLSLDELMHWSQNMADQHHWDGEAIRHDVMSTWLDQAEDITRWRHRLDQAPAEVELLAGIGDQRTWRDHWEGMLRQTPRAGWSSRAECNDRLSPDQRTRSGHRRCDADPASRVGQQRDRS